MIDLRVRKLLRRAEQPVARVADDNVDLPVRRKRLVHRFMYGGDVRDVEDAAVESIGILRKECLHLCLAPDRADDCIAALQRKFCHFIPESGRMPVMSQVLIRTPP